jgi:hypothetical protein
MKQSPSRIVNRDDGECALLARAVLVLMGFNMKFISKNVSN